MHDLPPSKTGPFRSRWLGKICYGVGWAMATAAVLPILLLSGEPPPKPSKEAPPFTGGAISLGLGVALIALDGVLIVIDGRRAVGLVFVSVAFLVIGLIGLVGHLLIYYSQRLLAKDARETLGRQGADHDRSQSTSANHSREREIEAQAFLLLRSFAQDESGLIRSSFEQKLAKALDEIDGVGPLIAIGKPGERLQTLGADRLYVDDQSWRDTALDLMTRSKLIFVIAGETGGLFWEIRTLVETVSPTKVIFVFGRKTAQSYGEFRRVCRSVGIALPETHDFGPFIAFRENWTPVPVFGDKVPVRLVPRILTRGFTAIVHELLRRLPKEAQVRVPSTDLTYTDWIFAALLAAMYFSFPLVIILSAMGISPGSSPATFWITTTTLVLVELALAFKLLDWSNMSI
jgi:hypothetical protein